MDDIFKKQEEALTLEQASGLAKEIAIERLGVDTGSQMSPSQECKSAMSVVYGDPNEAHSKDDAGNISLNKKPSMMSDSERLSLMKSIRENVYSKHKVGV